MCHWFYISLMRFGDLAWVITVLHEWVYYIIISETKLSQKVYLLGQASSVQRHFPSFVRLRKQKLEIMLRVEAITIYAAWVSAKEQ